VLCLCSIPDPAENIALLYKCLKPGGRWYVFEHVVAFPEQGRFMALYQGASYISLSASSITFAFPTCLRRLLAT
jgi:hypothetical protein